jgi:uncharacterized FlaG/YvyC family protein
MVGPITNQVPLVGPMRPDAGLKEQEERRVANEQSRKVSPPKDASGDETKSDEILTAESVINKLSQGVNSLTGRLSIEQDDESGEFIYRILDTETGEILNQWPREELLRQARIARTNYEGLVIDESA